mgnify:CR=1
ISTVGEHLLSPDCSMDATGAELVYAKQIFFSISSSALCIFVYGVCRFMTCVRCKPWKLRYGSNLYTNKDKFVVS